MSAGKLSIGEVAARSGVTTSALRFYEGRGLIASVRTPGGQRRYDRSALRRVAVIQVAQRVGLTLTEIGNELAILPQGRTPTRADWARLSRGWRAGLDERVRLLLALRDDLDGCIGCGCLSLRRCRLYNAADAAAAEGAGARAFR